MKFKLLIFAILSLLVAKVLSASDTLSDNKVEILKSQHIKFLRMDSISVAHKNYQDAINYRWKAIQLNDSIKKHTLQTNIEKFMAESELETKQLNSEILSHQLIASRLKNRRNIIVSFSLLLGILLSILVILIIRKNLAFNAEATNKLILKKDELESVNQKLKEASDTKNKFFSIIAHDIKNPFSTVLGFTELLFFNYNNLSAEKKEKYIHLLHKSAEGVFDFIQNLFSWAQSQTREVRFTPARFALCRCIEETIKFQEQTALKKRVRIDFQKKEPCEIFADQNMLKAIISNILSNAIKFSHQYDIIKIENHEHPDFTEIIISDNGIGMDNKQLDNLFKLNERVSTSGTAGESGTGLGLLICKEFMDFHKGKITVESDPEKGTTFRLIFPIKTMDT